MGDYYIDLNRKDLEDPVISIATRVRWISYKYSSLPKGAKKAPLSDPRHTISISEDDRMVRGVPLYLLRE